MSIKEFYDLNPTLIPSFKERILGDESGRLRNSWIYSPYTNRKIKPYIRRDVESIPKKFLLLEELFNKYKSKFDSPIPVERAPIDYCYLQPKYLYQVNQMLCDNFWRGIDISESLVYPEYSIIALYKKLVIGCGFITPDGYITYICVHTEWRSMKIGSFMLYHLTQSCPDKDITLHVSVTNDAVLLYNKFGFKPEQYIVNFYSKYIPEGSLLSNNAFLLRLRR